MKASSEAITFGKYGKPLESRVKPLRVDDEAIPTADSSWILFAKGHG